MLRRKMINFSNAKFIKSASKASESPKGNYPEILLCGKSNVGKSSFINAFCNQKRLAFTSSKPGHTKLLNFYLIDNKFYFVDAPGYGYAAGGIDLDEIFSDLMDSYFDENNLKLVLVLVDSRRGLQENDIEIINYLETACIKYAIIFTKSDKLNQSEKAKLIKDINEQCINQLDYFFISSLENKTLEKIRSYISNLL